MGKEQNSEYYNKVYQQGGANNTYLKHYAKTPYYHMWTRAISWLKELGAEEQLIVDLGCGPGQFAEMLCHRGFKHYRGYDFSNKAIEMAESRECFSKDQTPGYGFTPRNLLDISISEMNDGDVFTLFEVLEHIDNDMDVLHKINYGKPVIFSVPNFDDTSHVRHFRSPMAVYRRYGGIVSIQDTVPFPAEKKGRTRYLIKGVKI